MREEPLRLNFTKKGIEALASDAKRLIYHDTHAHGLCLRVEPSGRKSFCWFRKVNGRPTWKHIGKFPDLSVQNARTKAAEYNSQFARWKADEYEGANPFERRRDLTLGAVLEDYVERQLKPRSKNPDRAIKAARWSFDKYVPTWKNRRVSATHQEDILALHSRIGQENGQTTANRVIQFLRTLFNWAREEMHWSGENPVKRRFKFYKENSRDRYLLPQEMHPVFQALAEEPSRDLRDFILMAMFTGARRSDILSMGWEHINFHNGNESWRIPDPKSKTPYTVQLIPEVVMVLKERRATCSGPWVFPGTGRTGHLTGFKHSWKAFLKRAQLTNFRIHDLRRTLGSWLASRNASLQVIGATLGHQSSAVTEVYSRLRPDAIRQAVDEATREMIRASKKKPKLLTAGKKDG